MLSITTVADIPMAEAAEGDMIYWGVTEDNRLIISTNESYVNSYVVDGQQGSFASDTNFTIALIPWNSYKSAITDIQVESGVKPKSTGFWFDCCSNATSFDLSGLDTSSVTTMTNMFKNCSKIESLDLSYFNTTSVQSMSEMFYGCSALTSLDLSNFNTTNVTSMSNMFTACNNVKSFNLSYFNTENVSNMSRMFFGCNVESLDLSSFTIGSSTQVNLMLTSCYIAKTLYLPKIIGRKIDLPEGKFWNSISLPLISGSVTSANASQTLTRHDTHSYVEGVCSLCGDIQPIYWGISDDKELVISSDEVYVNSKVNSDKKGSFASNSLDVPWQSYLSDGICKVTVGGGTIYPVSLKDWFLNGAAIASVDLSALNTSHVTDMSNMFSGCSALASIDLSNFNTLNVTNMSYMFYDCGNLKSLDLSKFDLIRSVNVFQMLTSCSKLETIVSPKSIAAEVQLNLPGKFWDGRHDLTSLDSVNIVGIGGQKLTRHDEHKYVDDICTVCGVEQRIYWSLYTIDSNSYELYLSNDERVDKQNNDLHGYIPTTSTDVPWLDKFPYKRVTSVIILNKIYPKCTAQWFKGFSITDIPTLSNLITADVTDMSEMFSHCERLTSIDLSDFDTANVTNMREMFFLCEELISLDLSAFDTSKVTDMYKMFNRCNALETIRFSEKFDTSSITDMSEMFSGCNVLASLDLSNFNTSKVTNMQRMFENCKKLASVDISNFDLSNVEDMSFMFYRCESLKNIDLSGLNAHKVTTMASMFCNCSLLVTVNLTNFNTLGVTNMNMMFNSCAKLTSIIGLNTINTSNVENMEAIFAYCPALTEADISGWDMSKVSNISGMFVMCSALTSVDFSHCFDNGSTPMNIAHLFIYCTNLSSVNMSGIKSNVTVRTNDFAECNALNEIILPEILDPSGEISLPGTFWNGEENLTKAKAVNKGQKLVRHDDCEVEHYARTEATCEESGNSEYWRCTICGKYYSDENATAEITDKNSVIINALGHAYGRWTVVKVATCTEEGRRERVCTRDGHRETAVIAKIAHTVVTDAAVDPTCTDTGLTEGKHCSVCHTVLEAQTTVAALGHDYGEWEVTKAATCTEEGSRKHVCKRDGHIETETIAKIAHTVVADAAVAPTCTDTGLTEGKHCSVCHTVLEAQTTVAALGHDYGEWEVTKAASCTEEGSRKHVCRRDGHIETETIAKIAHTVVTDGAVAPTCTGTGLTEGKHCSVCHTVLEAQTTVAALGHDYGEWTVTKNPTVDEYGEEQRVCSHDSSHVETRQIEKLPAPQPQIDWKWIIILIVLVVIVLCEISYLVYHRMRKNRDAEEVEQ